MTRRTVLVAFEVEDDTPSDTITAGVRTRLTRWRATTPSSIRVAVTAHVAAQAILTAAQVGLEGALYWVPEPTLHDAWTALSTLTDDPKD